MLGGGTGGVDQREVTAAATGRITVLTAGRSIVVQILSTSDALKRITLPSTEIAAPAVIGQQI